MDDILRSLGLGELVETFRENEVGPKEVVLLTDSEFSKLGITAIGKRVQLRNRSKMELDGATEDSPEVQRIREFQAARRGKRSYAPPEHVQRFVKKPTRKICVGWKHFTAPNAFKQISSSQGGGTHALNVPKSTTLSELTNLSADLFFPNGFSRLQRLSLQDLNFRLTTFTGEPLQDTLETGESFTVLGYIEQVTNPVRVYLATSVKDVEANVSAEPSIPDRSSIAVQAILSTPEDMEAELPNSGIANIHDDAEPSVRGESAQAVQTTPYRNGAVSRLSLRRHLQSIASRPIRPIPQWSSWHDNHGDDDSVMISSEEDEPTFVEAGTPNVHIRINSETIPSNQEDEHVGEELQRAFLALLDSLEGEEELTVDRSRLLDNALQEYSDPELATKCLHIKFSGELGDDLGGLTKDFLTNLWKLLIESFFQGEDALVPFLPLYKMRQDKDKYITIGRILSHTAALLQIVPPRLSRSSLLGIVFGEDSVGEELLLDDFLLYSTPSDRALLRKSLRNFDTLTKSQTEDLIDFYTINGLQQVPTQPKVRQQILSIAQDVLVDKPRPLLVKLKQGIPAIHTELFWSLLTEKGIDMLFKKQRPTSAKVVKIIKPAESDLRIEEERSLHFFKQYVAELDQEDLSDMLLFITGSTCMPENITVNFRKVTGDLRCPIAHTCSNVIELPSSYSSLQDLKRHFRAVLACSHSFEMSIL